MDYGRHPIELGDPAESLAGVGQQCALLGRDALRFAPQRRHLDAVHALAPCVPLHELRFDRVLGSAEAISGFGTIGFRGHDQVGAETIATICARLRASRLEPLSGRVTNQH